MLISQFNRDVQKLPDWVNSVTMYKSRNPATFIGSDPKNSSYLVDPRDKTKRALGFISNGQDGSQGTVVNINVTFSEPYKITLYMVSDLKPNASVSRDGILGI